MSEPVFVYPYHNYESYADLKALVRLAGYTAMGCEEASNHPMLPETLIYCAGPRGADWWIPGVRYQGESHTYIYWDLERYSAGLGPDPRFDETWCSDQGFAEQAGLRFVPLGTDRRLATLYANDQSGSCLVDFDFAHMSYESFRRQAIYGALRGRGVKLAPNGWGDARDSVLRRSTAMLCVHQDDEPQTEPLRLALAAAYDMPVLSEYAVDFSPWSIDTIEPSFFGPGKNGYWLKPPPLEEYSFKRYIEEALGA